MTPSHSFQMAVSNLNLFIINRFWPNHVLRFLHSMYYPFKKGGEIMSYYGGYGCHYGYAPVAGVAHHAPGTGFALIVVLFILLIIVGTAFTHKKC